ncbi:glycosyltransferase family 2 protein [Blastococcus sp. TBT05-19]|uniref:glycosyltransferase family 2 protein n=1 Tax=Blastococcus sp. TBT05-19 TaxID=2250581 RepID=UPI0011BEBB78|nr:glycosyltransferase family 2 protein [Blastococcus sp. TBT05-19]
MTLDVSVLIVTYNSDRYIADCLTSLATALKGVDAEILVYDNASNDDTLRTVADFPGVRVIAGDANIGFAAACNRLAAQSHGRYLWFLNPDTRVRAEAVRELLKAADHFPSAKLYGARTVAPDGRTVMGSAQGEMTLWSLTCFATGVSTVFPGRRWADPESIPGWDRATTRHVPMLSGGALMVSRAAWDRLGGFDERYFMYAEDADLCARARRLRYAPLFVAPAIVEHEVGGSSSAGGKVVLLHRGKVTYARALWSPLRAALGVRLLLVGVALRAYASRLGVFPDRPGRSAGHAWAEAWNRRREWRHGWEGEKALRRAP